MRTHELAKSLLSAEDMPIKLFPYGEGDEVHSLEVVYRGYEKGMQLISLNTSLVRSHYRDSLTLSQPSKSAEPHQQGSQPPPEESAP